MALGLASCSSSETDHSTSRGSTVADAAPVADAAFAHFDNYAAPSTPTVGSANTATAERSLSRPSTEPCVVPLFDNLAFTEGDAGGGSATGDTAGATREFAFSPPVSCPAPWSEVVFEGNFTVTGGRQYDRTATVWIGGTCIYFGTTVEPWNGATPTWSIESDVSDYAALFDQPGTGSVSLGNQLSDVRPGIPAFSARLVFYPVSQDAPPADAADRVLALAPGSVPSHLDSASNRLDSTLTLPRNIERAELDLFTQSQAGDEEWFRCLPDPAAELMGVCDSSAFREARVFVDGQLAGIAPVYPWIYTGGLDPLLWQPIPGVHTLNFAPYRVDLTPFAGPLSDGRAHQISVEVTGAVDYFSVTGALLLHLDPVAEQVTGTVRPDPAGPTPDPAIQNSLTITDGATRGAVSTRSDLDLTVSGSIETSHGPVSTTVHQRVLFTNDQQLDISASAQRQEVTQDTRIESTTTRRVGDAMPETTTVTKQWPLHLVVDRVAPGEGRHTATTTLQQSEVTTEVVPAGDRSVTRTLSTTVESEDTLRTDPAVPGNVAGYDNQASTQTVSFSDDGRCTTRRVSAAANVVTDIVEDPSCPEAAG